MPNQYKLHLVSALPPQESSVYSKPPKGGFGLAEDDLIYQMVLENLRRGDHSNFNRRHDEDDVDD